MRGWLLTIAVVLAGAANARADDTCATRANTRKFAGAAQTSFMKKCQKDATTTCDAAATSRKLSGAARTSFTKKCVSDAVGA